MKVAKHTYFEAFALVSFKVDYNAFPSIFYLSLFHLLITCLHSTNSLESLSGKIFEHIQDW